MASNPLSLPLKQARKRTEVQIVRYTPSVRTVVITLVALLILFGWLHLILALEIASTGRQIQIETGELEKIQRTNDMLRWTIASELSSTEMAQRAVAKGYVRQEPVYLPLSQLLTQP